MSKYMIKNKTQMVYEADKYVKQASDQYKDEEFLKPRTFNLK